MPAASDFDCNYQADYCNERMQLAREACKKLVKYSYYKIFVTRLCFGVTRLCFDVTRLWVLWCLF